MIAEVGVGPARRELKWMLSHARAPKLRSRREFAEQELILPEGPYKGRRFKASRQPFAGLWLDAVDGTLAYQTGRFSKIVTTGPSQSGKTLIATIVPLLYHLFEVGESVGFALPTMDMAEEKWRRDLLPAIERTRFRELLPSYGEGSQRGKVKNMVTLTNGAALKFFSAGGSDKSRAHFTVRVLIITEANAFGGAAETSNESTKLEQLFARSKSFGSSALAYLECTVEIETDVIWSNYKLSTESRLACPCPHCAAWVTPERENLLGWQEATSSEAAREQAHFVCPSCQGTLSEDERRVMNERSMLVHRGQEIEPAELTEGRKESKGGRRKGSLLPLLPSVQTPRLSGEPPRTRTLGFRWNAFNNLFASPAELGEGEWNDARSVEEEAAERKQCQFIWCVPHKSNVEAVASLSANELTGRVWTTPKGLVPEDAVYVSAGADLGKWNAYYVAVAWSPVAASGDFPAGWRGVVFDYDRLEVESNRLGVEPALLNVLRTLREKFEAGWAWQSHGTPRPVDVAGFDAGWQGGPEGPHQVVYQFMRECQASAATRDRYWATKGFGEGQLAGTSYHAPKQTNKSILLVGDSYHVVAQPASGIGLVEFDADAWKTHWHERLACDRRSSAVLLHAAIPKTHLNIARHWTAEKEQTEFVPGKGEITKWVRLRKSNHYFDTSVIADVMGHFAGVRIVRERPQKSEVRDQRSNGPARVTTPDGRPFLITER